MQQNCTLTYVKNSFKIYRTLPRFNSIAPSAVTIGNFDGVHLGHQAILDQLNKAAHNENLVSTVITFDPHPRAYFSQRFNKPRLNPKQIYTQRDKLNTLTQQNVKQIVLLKFNDLLADMKAEDFIINLLVKGLNTKYLLVGDDFKFGYKRQGNINLLKEYGDKHGFTTQTIKDITDNAQQRISSSALRLALSQAELNVASQSLGKNYTITGHVVHGQKLGRTIGVPTINVNVHQNCALKYGVYVVKVKGLDNKTYQGVASIGERPTVIDQGKVVLEVHILNAKPQAYGKLVCVEFLHFLRNEVKFPDLTTMMAAIQQDIQQSINYFVENGL